MDQTPQITTNNYQSRWPILPKWFVIILLVITYPLGILLMWLFTRWSVKSKLLITVGPFLVLLALILYVFFSLNNQRHNLKSKTMINNNREATVSGVSNVGNDTVLKSYKSKALGISLDYPNDWKYIEGGQYKGRDFQIQEVHFKEDHFGATGYSTSIEARKRANNDELDLNEYIDLSNDFKENTPKINLDINGAKAIQMVGDTGIQTYLIDPKDKRVVFSVWITTNLKIGGVIKNIDKHIETYQKMIRTFKFNED